MTNLPSDFEARMRRQGERYKGEQIVSSTNNHLMQLQILRKNIYVVMAGSLRILRDLYSVENLSVIEGVRLRHIVETLVARYRGQVEMLFSGEWTDEEFVTRHTSPAQEAADEWLLDCYGMHAGVFLRLKTSEKERFELQRQDAHGI